MATAPAVGDFNGDGAQDLLLRHADGRWHVYAMAGRGPVAADSGAVAGLPADRAWQFQGVGDFDGDGRDEVLLRHDDGSWRIDALDGYRRVAAASGDAALARSPRYRTAAVADFDGDGKDDVLLRSENGAWYYYPMDGRTPRRTGRGFADLPRDPNLRLAAVGDLNGDGRADVLLRDGGGAWYYYPMDGRTVVDAGRGEAELTADRAYRPVAIGNFGGDRSAVLLRKDNGAWRYYPMDGRTAAEAGRGFAALTPDLTYRAAAVGDFDGDGRAGVLLRGGDGAWYLYAMAGRRPVRSASGYADLTLDPAWRMADAAAAEAFRDCADCPPMVEAPAGSFTMGSPPGEAARADDEGPRRVVDFAAPFAIGEREVTFREWEACTAGGGCGGHEPADHGWGGGDQPVIEVTWAQARSYAAWLAARTGEPYRLPSEAEWEYAARAGTSGPFHTGATISTDLANYDGTLAPYGPGRPGVDRARPVAAGSFGANAFGLRDAHGNVAEWVLDCWSADYGDAPTDGSARDPEACAQRVARGGSWRDEAARLRSARREPHDLAHHDDALGFRVAKDLAARPPPETAADVFNDRVSPTVQSKCVSCHRADGSAAATRLVFAAASDADHLATNLEALRRLASLKDGGMELILDKVRGIDHDGGAPLPAETSEYESLAELLALLDGGILDDDRDDDTIDDDRFGIGGTADAGGGNAPLAHAQCEFAALGHDRLGSGEQIATATADGDGAFRMFAPPETDGHIVCRPPGLSAVRLRAFLRTGAAGTGADDRTVSPGTTVVAMALAVDALRNPEADMAAAAAALSGSYAGDAGFGLLADAAAGLFGVLRQRGADAAFAELLIDAFGNSRIDGLGTAPDLTDALNGALATAERRAGGRIFPAAARIFADLPLLAAAMGVDDPPPPPPLARDPGDLAHLADGFRTPEFARNPALYHLNAHWAYARGLSGAGETAGMVDTGLYAAHEEFAGRLHDETVYTVLGDDTDGDGWPQFSYFKVGERDPASAYPEAQPESNAGCQGVFCKFYEYNHGSLMASLAVGARNGAGAHGVAFGAKLLFKPFRQRGTLIGGPYYHPPGDKQPWRISRHQVVRQVGDLALGVSNSWLTGSATYWTGTHGRWPFHEVLTPRYARHQRHRLATDQSVMIWSAGNQPLAAGPLVDGAAVPSVSERQLRALSGGERGLADLLLTSEERAGLSEAEALRRAERMLGALRRRWLAVVALVDIDDDTATHIVCAAGNAADGVDCEPDWTLLVSARCGFASDWCIAVGPSWGGVSTSMRQPPQTTGSYAGQGFRTSEAAATASGALAVLRQAYRDADGRLTAPTNTILKRLGKTARRSVFDPDARHDWDQRNVLVREEEMIRSLIRYAGASDDELREFIDTARAELNGSASTGDDGTGRDRDDRLRILNRFVPYWAVIQTGLIHEMLNAANGNEARTNDLLAQLIRQVEWIDSQLSRRGRTRDTVTDDDVREIAITSLIGHGLIDLKAATDPER